VRAYENIMQAWLASGTTASGTTPSGTTSSGTIPSGTTLSSSVTRPAIPATVETVYVLSRVTLGADVKITSIVLDAMKRRFPASTITLVGGAKAAGLFAADEKISKLVAEYPRGGPVHQRIGFSANLHYLLAGPNAIVVDPDSRMTQLGIVPPCDPARYFHFGSRTAGGDSAANLTALTEEWLAATFGAGGAAYVAPEPVRIADSGPFAAISFGVGGNLTKRVAGEFETGVIRLLAKRFPVLWVDRGAGGEEAERATAAVDASGASGTVRFWEGTFAGFASITRQSALYLGYDSAGQHAAAASGVPLITIFAGAASGRFRARWSPAGPGPITVIDADRSSPEVCLERVRQSLPGDAGRH
jgi:hypothetical protein